jgi:uncharacterized protein YceK
MRLLATLVVFLMLSGCTAMLVGGSATTEGPAGCEQSEKKDQEREC